MRQIPVEEAQVGDVVAKPVQDQNGRPLLPAGAKMVVTINHEINNPLSIISTNAQTLRLLNKDIDEKAQAKLVRIEDQVKRIAEVTERLRKLDEIATDEYIRGGEQMIDVWNEGQKGG